MAERARCKICDRTFKNADGLGHHNAAKHPENTEKEKKPINLGKYKGWFIFLIVLAGIVALLVWSSSSKIILPPTDMVGHIEVSPKSHILKEPMDILVHKHMLEHVDGQEGGRGGVIINYNCKDYECEKGLIENLEVFAGEYDHVYVAPFKKMDAKIALTRLNRQKILEEFDEETIDLFVKY